jgi:hypothetical protein
MAVWEYTEDVDNYQTVLPENKDDNRLITIDHLHGKPFPKPWKPLSVYYPSREDLVAGDERALWKPGDVRRGEFPCIGGTVPVFTERAVNALLPLIEDNVEVLPLACEEDKLYIINVIDVVDCLDKERSKLKRFSSGGVMRVEHYVFIKEAIRGKHMFKIPELHVAVYVSDAFKSAVEENCLEGLLWKPLP